MTSFSDTLGNVLANVYDLVGWLTSATNTMPGLAAKTISYQYDAAGNRTRRSARPSNRWRARASRPDGTFTFAYDPENRLATAAKTGMSAAYAYDPAGRRMTKIVTGGTYAGTTFFLGAGDDEVAEYDLSGALIRRYVPGPGVDRPIAMVTAAGAKTYFHQDKTGSTIAMSDASGVLAEGPYTYDAYGNGAPPTGVPYKYTGRRLDPETGLYYYRARFYSAAIGRFLQTDPIGYKDDNNLYTYVGNDPTDKTDPTGLMDDFTASQYGDAVMKMTPQERAQIAAIGGGALAGGVAIGACVGGACEAAALAAWARLGVASPGAAAALPAIGNALTEGNPAGASAITREALSAGQLKNLGRFESKLPAAAGEVKLTQGPNGSATMEAVVPGRVSGSSATYTKTMDANGTTTAMTKTTVDPKGEVVHIKDKFN